MKRRFIGTAHLSVHIFHVENSWRDVQRRNTGIKTIGNLIWAQNSISDVMEISLCSDLV
jgi:hypothetical protein